MNITVGICTKNRYEGLAQCLISIALQNSDHVDEVIIVDDSDSPKDLREIVNFHYIFSLLKHHGIEYRVIFGNKRGQHFSHQTIQEQAKNDLIFRIDDDEVADPECIDNLYMLMREKVGAVGPLVLTPPVQEMPKDAENTFKNPYAPNIQWYEHNGVSDVDHLHSCFLYRKGIAKYNLDLSPVAHREETMFTMDIKKAGWELMVDSEAIVWHFRNPDGGIRSHKNEEFYKHDQDIFEKYLGGKLPKLIVLDSGIGDHFCFKHLLEELQQRHHELIIACCYPDVFFDCRNVKLISIADAIKMRGDISEFNIYRKMIEWNWKTSMLDAYRKLYL